MKIITLTILSFLSFNLYGQNESRFIFFDACSNEIVELDYELWFSDTTIQVQGGQSVKLKPNYYQLSTHIKWQEMNTTFFFDIIIKNEDRVDTLYLNKVRSFSPMILHPGPGSLKHYNCDKLSNGLLTEIDSNNVVRFKGSFKEGIPTSNLKYYNELGKRIRTEVYRNGNLIKMKN